MAAALRRRAVALEFSTGLGGAREGGPGRAGPLSRLTGLWPPPRAPPPRPSPAALPLPACRAAPAWRAAILCEGGRRDLAPADAAIVEGFFGPLGASSVTECWCGPSRLFVGLA